MFGLEPTPFDLRLVAFRIPIRVHPSFWIAGAILGWRPEHPFITFLWVMCLFVSVVVHELGHALVAEAFRWRSEIVLYWCGGLALSQRYHARTPWKDIAVALAGPCAGFGLFGLVLGADFLLNVFHVRQPVVMYQIYSMLIFINLFWGLVNLLPALPLDGGHVCQSLLEVLRWRNPLRTAMQISILVAGSAAFVFFTYFDSTFAGMLFAMIALQNLAALQETRY